MFAPDNVFPPLPCYHERGIYLKFQHRVAKRRSMLVFSKIVNEALFLGSKLGRFFIEADFRIIYR